MIFVLFWRLGCCNLSLIRNDLFGSKEDWRPKRRKPQSLSIPEFLFLKLFIRDFPMGGSVLKVVMGLAIRRKSTVEKRWKRGLTLIFPLSHQSISLPPLTLSSKLILYSARMKGRRRRTLALSTLPGPISTQTISHCRSCILEFVRRKSSQESFKERSPYHDEFANTEMKIHLADLVTISTDCLGFCLELGPEPASGRLGLVVGRVQFSWVHFSRLTSRLRCSLWRGQLFFRH